MSNTRELIKVIGTDIIELLLEKNKSYGDTANNPPNIFSNLDSNQAIRARLDDKLSRIKQLGLDHKGSKKIDESAKDTLKDIVGYIILLLVNMEKKEDPKLIEWEQTSTEDVDI